VEVSIPLPEMLQNIFLERWQWKNNIMFFTSFEDLKNMENQVAWFLAKLCKAEKGVQKDK
jgi:hypothetical protein